MSHEKRNMELMQTLDDAWNAARGSNDPAVQHLPSRPVSRRARTTRPSRVNCCYIPHLTHGSKLSERVFCRELPDGCLRAPLRP